MCVALIKKVSKADVWIIRKDKITHGSMGESMINFVTSNIGKFVEAQGVFDEIMQKNIGYTEVQADTLEEVVVYGMEEVGSRLKGPVMIEDAGLFIEALKGFPGVYSAYVQKTIGNAGILKLMKDLEDRSAFFRSVVGYVEPGIKPVMFSGEIHGSIGFEQRGSKGFGYDPIFYINNKSLGEIDIDEKNKVSHRGESMRALKLWLDSR